MLLYTQKTQYKVESTSTSAYASRRQCTRAAARVFDRGVWGVSTATTTVVIRGFCVVHFPTQIGEHRRERDKEQPKNRGWMLPVLCAYFGGALSPYKIGISVGFDFHDQDRTYRHGKSPTFTSLFSCFCFLQQGRRSASWAYEGFQEGRRCPRVPREPLH